ncbi:GNAT family N-acetyltransferase [Catelliglobosispora koreensis]|uniref:GNAT family N-acetyltransferase n=1 Tax=Catelliglobosispora koreensis TaxID=129052 RepID=UPI0003828B7D|nr:GNAT family N-acetyltransferase [Catelliglobosispora koreensis]
MEIVIKPTRYGAPSAQKLIAELFDDLTARYGSGDATPVDPMQFDPPDGGFFVAYLAGEPVGCGAWRSHNGSEKVAEVKRVYVAEKTRGQGLARRIMATLEEDARAHGRTRMILETGAPQHEAVALYESLGYERIEPFGFYKNEPDVRCFGRDL